jgi:bifunctional DNA-binding transcriptional regulator/antitoxin component of YhaV-PrlF toxin-antitoxin module
MREILINVTSKGQVTILAEVRQLLGVQRRWKVAFLIEDREW